MLGLRNIPISQRLWLILLTSVLMLLVLAGLLLKQHRDDLYAAKALKTRHVVESAGGILRHFHDLEQAGLPREQAQLQASAVMRRLRYNGEDYFWLEDLDTRLVMHPNASLEGKRMSGTRDADGKQIFDEMVELAKRDGAGLMHYRWPRPGSEQPLEKVSYVELFEPWGWIIGSGIYVDDVEAEFRSQALHALLLLLGIVLLVAADRKLTQ